MTDLADCGRAALRNLIILLLVVVIVLMIKSRYSNHTGKVPHPCWTTRPELVTGVGYPGLVPLSVVNVDIHAIQL